MSCLTPYPQKMKGKGKALFIEHKKPSELKNLTSECGANPGLIAQAQITKGGCDRGIGCPVVTQPHTESKGDADASAGGY